MKINSEIIDNKISEVVSKKDQELFKKITGQDIQKFINHDLLFISLLAFNMQEIDKCLETVGKPRDVSIYGYIIKKYGEIAAYAFKNICCVVRRI